MTYRYPTNNACSDIYFLIRRIAKGSSCNVLKVLVGSLPRCPGNEWTATDYRRLRTNLVWGISEGLRGESKFKLELDEYDKLNELCSLYLRLNCHTDMTKELYEEFVATLERVYPEFLKPKMIIL